MFLPNTGRRTCFSINPIKNHLLKIGSMDWALPPNLSVRSKRDIRWRNAMIFLNGAIAKQGLAASVIADWCGPCRQLAPTMDSLADQFAGKIKFVKVNVNESPKLAQQFQVEGIPMLVFLQNGKTVGTSVGLQAKEDLIQRLDLLLQANAQPAAKSHAF